MMGRKGAEGVLRILERTMLAALCVWGIVEAGCGLLQLVGLQASRHALYSLTGHFINPGPFGGFIACVMAVCGAWLMRSRGEADAVGRGLRILAWAALGAGALVLPVSMSRTAWLALAAALGLEALRLRPLRAWLRRNKWFGPAAAVLVVVALAGLYLLKTESALGRLHIWRMECRAIAEHPWTGAGPGAGLAAYGEAQEAFFRAHLETVSPTVVRVAGSPEYAFNEFLGAGMAYGLPGMLLALALVVSSILVLYRKGSPFAAGLAAWAVFACASYPLAAVQLRILAAAFLLMAVATGLATLRGRAANAVPIVAAVLLGGWVAFRGGPEWDAAGEVREAYSHGYVLHQAGRYAESMAVLARGAEKSCDPMFEVMMGKNAEALGDDAAAGALYEKAHYMVPSRLYPLVRQMRLRIRQGRDAEALTLAEQIVGMPVNQRHKGMVQLLKETKVSLDSLKKVLTLSDGEKIVAE